MKSEIFFSWNVRQVEEDLIATQLGVNVCLGTGKYLGLPSMIGRSKKSLFKFIKIEFGGRLMCGVVDCFQRLTKKF